VTSARTSGICLSAQSGKEFDVVVESNILGFHVYKVVWTPVTGEFLTCELEDEYSFEPFGTSDALLIEFCASIYPSLIDLTRFH